MMERTMNSLLLPFQQTRRLKGHELSVNLLIGVEEKDSTRRWDERGESSLHWMTGLVIKASFKEAPMFLMGKGINFM